MSNFASTSSSIHLSDFNDHIFKGLAAGVLSASVTKTSVAPIDRIKLILQLQNRTLSIYGQTQPYKGIVDCFKRLCAEQGWRSLWRGNSASLVRIVPSNVLNIAFRDYFRVMFLSNVNRRKQRLRFYAGNIAAGGAGGAITLFFVHPLDLVRTKLAIESESGLMNCVKSVYHTQGTPGFYRGFTASLSFIIASRAVFFGIFDSIRLTMSEERKQSISFTTTWLLAQMSLIVSSTVCYPLDTVRRKLMMQSTATEYRNFAHCFVTIVRNKGFHTLYSGLFSNTLKCSSSALILALYYEALKYF